MANFIDKLFETPTEVEAQSPLDEIQNAGITQPAGGQGEAFYQRENEVMPFGLAGASADESDDLGAANNLVHACVERIISRAVGAKMYMANFDPAAPPLQPNWRVSPYHWYRQLYEQLLLTGNALVWLDQQGNYNVGLTNKSDYDEGSNVWSIGIDRKGTQIKRMPGQGVIHFYLGGRQGIVPHKVESPLRKIKRALMLYNETRELLTDYAVNGHRLAGTFQATREVMDQNRMRNMVKDLKKQLDTRSSRFAVMASPNYLEYRPSGQVGQPFVSGLDVAAKEVGRVYGVPPEMLGLLGYRGDYMNTDNHLLTEAVFPLLDSVCGTWSEAMAMPVRYWPLSLHRPTLNSAAHVLMGLAQTGIMTINELRQLVGLSPLPDYDIMPMTAGAPERSEDRKKQGGNGARDPRSTHPGGGSQETDARRQQ